MRFPIIDSHHHIWKQSDLDWLQGEIQPRIFGDYTSIKKDYLIDDFIEDVVNFGVEQSVYIQCNWPIDKYYEEAKFVDDSFNNSGWPNAFIGYCNLLDPNAPEMLDKLFDYPLTRGIRMQLHWHERELYSFASAPDIMEDSIFNNNFEYLAKKDSIFELQVFQSQLSHTKNLLKRFPETTFVLQHAGMPHDLSNTGWAEWNIFMESLAEYKNLFIKLSGLGTFINKNDPEFISNIVQKVLANYPSDRCLFGSNFPIEKIWCNYGDLINAFRMATRNIPITDQKNIFHDTASKVYGI